MLVGQHFLPYILFSLYLTYLGKIYVMGGSDGSRSLNSVEIFDCDTNSWSSGPALQTPRSNAGVAVIAGRLYIAGGYGSKLKISEQ